MTSLYNFYLNLPSDYAFGILGKAFNRFVRKFAKADLDKKIVDRYVMERSKRINGINKTENRNPRIIVSLTSFPGRIDTIWICIESLMRQSFKPDMIILWLADCQFQERKIQESLSRLQDRGLTIHWRDNLRAHTKYHYAMKEYPNDIIITVDDDSYYPQNVVENLIRMHALYPEHICSNRCHLMKYSRSGELKPYRRWLHNYSPQKYVVSNELFFTGVGGVLYPPHCMPDVLFDFDIAKKICFHGDDVWLNFCARQKGTKIVTDGTFNKDFICIGNSQNEKLVNINVISGGNDTQIQAVREYLKVL